MIVTNRVGADIQFIHVRFYGRRDQPILDNLVGSEVIATFVNLIQYQHDPG